MAYPKPLPHNVRHIGTVKTKTGNEQRRYEVDCSFCGKTRGVNRHDHAIAASNKRCKSCSNKSNNPMGEHRGVRISWFHKARLQATTRRWQFLITIDDIADLFVKQNGLCALSSMPISVSGDLKDISGSIDRIDNNVGYLVSNIQLVHKRINMMRGPLSVRDFVDFCRAVTTAQTC